ncbi:MAG: alpha/beta fold hydrolase [Clostridia bacterium]|nr:alpha/beta fold hydrolase [Clostridia bacterium]
MKNTIKRVVSLVLCAAMLVSAGAVGASAATKTECEGNCGRSPVIILPGINHSPTYLYNEDNTPYLDADGNEVGGTLLILELSKLWGTLPKLVVSLLATLTLQIPLGLEDAAYETASAAFWVQECDNDGNHVNNLQTQRWNHPISEMTQDDKDWLYRMIPLQAVEKEIGGDHIYMFTFNLVGDPMQSAKELDAYIDMVMEQTGHDKVTLLPVSLGGTILTAYLDEYGHDKVDEIVNAVACLDGTDIVADMMERKWNLADEYLYHEFVPPILGDDATLGYLINCVLHIIPKAGVEAILTGAISAILDKMMINCPQIWAMIPSYRYNALAERYLNNAPEKAKLKEKTDRFQTARLNLKQNILDAVADGVKVNTIAGANLSFGEQDYTFFGIVASAHDYNTDGIINLTSTTLGATGAPAGKTLDDISYKKNTYCTNPNHNHISPDNKVDVSTAILPENTWIFLDQHHEVGNNDIVLNLVKAILVGDVANVNDDPETYPQFNYSCNTKYIRRWRIPDAKGLLEDDAEGEITLPAEDKKELEEAIAQGEAVINATIADQAKVTAAEDRLNAILAKYDLYTYPEEPTGFDIFLDDTMEGLSKFLVTWLGGGNLIDWVFSPITKLFK